MLNVAVYCGSRSGGDPAFAKAAQALGHAIGERGWRLVFGGGHVGLMGVIADATIQSGGLTLGVIPQRLQDREVAHAGLHTLQVVQTMHERKQVMADAADVFVALPGGIGTLEELFEVWTWRQLGYHQKPIALLNVNGYFDSLIAFIATAQDRSFMGEETTSLLTICQDTAELLNYLDAAAAHTL